MLITDKGFYVDNFVGTYSIEFDQADHQYVIVSKEYNHPSDSESTLEKKRVFEYDARDDDYIFINLANVDTDSDQSILNYCNKYGLPYSSQIISDRRQWLGTDVPASVAGMVARSGSWEYQRNDLMTLEGFHRAVIIVRKLIELRALLSEEQVTDAWYANFISTLIFFLFYSHEHDFQYAPSEELLPQNRAMRFQYLFQLFIRKNGFDAKVLADKQIRLFLNYCRALRSLTQEQVGPEQLWADLHSEIAEQVFTLFPDLLFDTDGNVVPVVYLSYGEVRFFGDLKFNNNPNDLEKMRQLGVEVFRSVINEGLGFASPSLVLDQGILRGGWKLSYQMHGIYMELFLEAAMDSMFRKCANPTCGNFFSASRNRRNKRFCCHECALLEAKRRSRRRKKENIDEPNV